MAPIRRYLRITKHSVLEVRIYLDRPSDAETWLLRRDNPALPRVLQAVRPLVLPKLREENERVKGKGKSKSKKKGVKDVVSEDEFDVSIFLTELSARHSLLTKQKSFKENPRLKSNSGKLTGWLTAGSTEETIVVPDKQVQPIVIREEDDEDTINLNKIPEAPKKSNISDNARKHHVNDGTPSESDDSDGLFIPPSKPSRRDRSASSEAGRASEILEPMDDKKLRMNTTYDGFSIYGRILCLVVKRKGISDSAGGSVVPGSSQKMMENWVSTQAAAEQAEDDDDNA